MTLRHNDCEERGCYVKTLPNWGFLDDCFPGKIRMGDIDGAVERHGCLFICEWKRPGAPVTTGQQIMFKNMSLRGNTITVCWGPVETMVPEKITIYHQGKVTQMRDPSERKIKKIAREWFKEVDAREAWVKDYAKECTRRYGDTPRA